jgi:hypothetical protein
MRCQERGLLWFLPALVLAGTLGQGCASPCRTDLDCESETELQRCNVATQECELLPQQQARTCDDADECTGGRTCFLGACQFAPSCQTFVAGAAFEYVARCDGTVTRGDATASSAGCDATFEFLALEGATRVLEVGAISATAETNDVELTLGDNSPVGCGRGRLDGAPGVVAFSGCDVGGVTCDLGLLRKSGPSTRVCFSDADCTAPATCGALVNAGGAASVGRCQ